MGGGSLKKMSFVIVMVIAISFILKTGKLRLFSTNEEVQSKKKCVEGA